MLVFLPKARKAAVVCYAVEARERLRGEEHGLRNKIDVFLAAGEPALLAAKEKGENIPIVVVSCDPLEKLLGSLARPGGNATGFTCVSSDLVGKRFSLLRSLLPRMRRVAMLYNKRDNHELEFRDAEAAAQSLNIGLLRFPVMSAADFELHSK